MAHWFVNARLGGAVRPANWKGWALLGGTIGMVALTGAGLLLLPGDPQQRFVSWLAIQAPIISLFLWLCDLKTPGGLSGQRGLRERVTRQ